jgi:hypothetical protein
MQASAEEGHDHLAATSFAVWGMLLADHLPRMPSLSSDVARHARQRQMRMFASRRHGSPLLPLPRGCG